MKYAVFASGGKQYKVVEGNIVELEKLKVDEGKTLTFDTVLFYSADGVVKIGQPQLSDITITAKVLGQIKGVKIRVAKFKAKARYRKVYGHRQQLTRVQIESINAGTSKKAKTETTEENKVKETKAKSVTKK